MASRTINDVVRSLGIDTDTGKPPSRSVAVELFHLVRNFSYVSNGMRDPLWVLENRAGSCSGKHILLRDLLRAAGFKADVETVEGDFAAGIPSVAAFSPELREALERAGIHDFHQIVSVDLGDETVLLDATWPDSLKVHGFPINDDWQGRGQTTLALKPERFLGPTEDVVPFKVALIEKLPEEKQRRRLEFLSLLNVGLASLEQATGHGNDDIRLDDGTEKRASQEPGRSRTG